MCVKFLFICRKAGRILATYIFRTNDDIDYRYFQIHFAGILQARVKL